MRGGYYWRLHPSSTSYYAISLSSNISSTFLSIEVRRVAGGRGWRSVSIHININHHRIIWSWEIEECADCLLLLRVEEAEGEGGRRQTGDVQGRRCHRGRSALAAAVAAATMVKAKSTSWSTFCCCLGPSRSQERGQKSKVKRCPQPSRLGPRRTDEQTQLIIERLSFVSAVGLTRSRGVGRPSRHLRIWEIGNWSRLE